MIKVLQILVFLIFLTSFAKAQACGWTKLTIYLTDAKGLLIKDAEIKTFDKNFGEENYLDYPKDENDYDYLEKNINSLRLRRNISWTEEKQAYFGSEGMCGGHSNVGIRISAEGFEKFDFVTHLPLGYTSFSIKLKRNGTNEISEKTKLAHFKGEFVNEYDDPNVPVAELEIVEKGGKKYIVKSNEYGSFSTDLPIGNYTIRVLKNDSQIIKIINFRVENTETMYLDSPITIPNRNNSKVGNKEKIKKEVIIDYQIIKRKNNK